MSDNELTASEEAKAQKQGKREAAVEVAKEQAVQEAYLDTGTQGEPDPNLNRWAGADEIQMFSHLIEGGIEALKKAIDPKDGIPEAKVAGLLILERNGKNRTEFVKLLMKRLGITDLRKELPQAGGPDYTNDTTNLTDL